MSKSKHRETSRFERNFLLLISSPYPKSNTYRKSARRLIGQSSHPVLLGSRGRRPGGGGGGAGGRFARLGGRLRAAGAGRRHRGRCRRHRLGLKRAQMAGVACHCDVTVRWGVTGPAELPIKDRRGGGRLQSLLRARWDGGQNESRASHRN